MPLALLDHPWLIQEGLEESSPAWGVLLKYADRVREHGLTPVPFLTEQQQLELTEALSSRPEGMGANGAAILRFAELLVRIKALLRRTPAPRTDVLRIGDLEVNRLTQQVRRAGERIELTSKEYGVLEYLLSSPGRVFSRTMILEHVWDQSFEGVTNIVDVYVRYLRRKLDDPFQTKLIHTVRGVGYCIREPEPRRQAEP